MDWNMVWQIALLIIGFVMLIKGADWFVDGAAGIADKLHIPQLIIGLTIVAMGTSAPEAAISISASVQGSADIAVGNILGSNILNILIILGITSIGFIDGILLWVLFIAYIAYLFIMTKKGKIQADESDDEDNDKKPKKVWQLILFGIIGIALVVFGSNITVNAATEIATMFGMSERFIGLTIVALGTSLPELVTSITAALKKNADIAIGNIVGSNIFNILFVIGTSAMITPVAYQKQFLIDSIFCVATAMLLLLLVLNKDKKLKRWGGIIMLICYAGYFVYLIR